MRRRPNKDQDVHKYNRRQQPLAIDRFIAAGINVFDVSDDRRTFYATPFDPHILVGNVKITDIGDDMVNLQFFSPAGTESINVTIDNAIWFLTNNYHPKEE